MIITPGSCKELSDNEIVAKSLEDLEYFSCLYQRYEAELLRYILRMTDLDGDEAQDVLQEAFIKIWRNLNEFDSSMKLSSWLYRIVHNETISHIRKKKSFGKDKTRDAELYRNILTDEQDLSAEKEERLFLIPLILDQMSMKYKEILILKFLEMKSYEEISDILKIPEGTVAIRINRAKQQFRDISSKLINNEK
jgi:RNA polymerase sigma-70 factor, ECF subfamily